MGVREEFSRNKQLDFKGNLRTPYISVSHGFLLLPNIVTTNLNLLYIYMYVYYIVLSLQALGYVSTSLKAVSGSF